MKIRVLLSFMIFTFLFSSFTSIVNIATIEAPAPRWEMLGAKKVNYGLDRDEINVTAKEGVFSALKLKVNRGGINLHRVAVHFGNGEVEELEVRANIAKGGETRVLDLPGNKRVIKKVVFWYDTKNYANQKAVLQLWGRH